MTLVITTQASGIILGSYTYNPFLITKSGTISGSDYGILGDFGTFWSITNQGAIEANNGLGVYLPSGGKLTNAAGASIIGSFLGVSIAGKPDAIARTGTVTNQGTIV